MTGRELSGETGRRVFTGRHGERPQRTPHTEAEPSWRFESCSQDHPLPPPARGAWSMEQGSAQSPARGSLLTSITAQLCRAGTHLSLEIPHVRAGPRGRGAGAPGSQIQEPEFSEAPSQEPPRVNTQHMPRPGRGPCWEKGGWHEAQDASPRGGSRASRGGSRPRGHEEGTTLPMPGR